MSDWIQVKGLVQEGYGVASGKSGGSRFPEGTIAMQLLKYHYNVWLPMIFKRAKFMGL